MSTRSGLLLLFWLFAHAAPVAAQAEQCRADLGIDGLLVRTVKVEWRGGWGSKLPLPIAPGDRFDHTKLNEAFRVVQQALNDDPLQESFEYYSRGSLSFLKVNACVKVVPATQCNDHLASWGQSGGANSCVDVIIRPFAVRLDLFQAGENLIPVPRANRPTLYRAAPKPLLAFNPTFGLEHDRAFGTAQTGRISTDLLKLPALLKGAPLPARATQLQIELGGRKSLNEPFYQADGRLALSRRTPGQPVEELALEASFDGNQSPLAAGKHFSNLARLGGSVQLRPRAAGLNAVRLSGQYRWAAQRFFNRTGTRAELTTEHAFEGRALLDGRLPERAGGGAVRGGLWFEASVPTAQAFKPYQRLAALIGYQTDLGRTEQTVGLEVLTGAGRIWGEAPQYARFYGGNSLRNFLYDATTSPTLRAFPTGPLLRSFGLGQAGAGASSQTGNGGTSYWHFSVNASLPLPRLSCPLIPSLSVSDEAATNDADAHPCRIKRPPKQVKTLKHVLKGLVNSGENLLAAQIAEELTDQGLPADQAETEGDKRAQLVFREIRPAMNYIVDKANLYALKPLLMFDVGRVGAPELLDKRTRVAVGGGLQLTLVIAKFELGYLRMVRGAPNDPRDNFVTRLYFQNLF
jgi:hypothetical protein